MDSINNLNSQNEDRISLDGEIDDITNIAGYSDMIKYKAKLKLLNINYINFKIIDVEHGKAICCILHNFKEPIRDIIIPNFVYELVISGCNIHCNNLILGNNTSIILVDGIIYCNNLILNSKINGITSICINKEVIFKKELDRLNYWFIPNSTINKLRIPKFIKEIDENAFDGSIIFSLDIEEYNGSLEFIKNINVYSIKMPKSLEILDIEYVNEVRKEVILPKSLKTIRGKKTDINYFILRIKLSDIKLNIDLESINIEEID